jgi:hypothetical protein
MQALMGVKGLYDAKEVHIHLLGTPAEGDYKRPFKAAPSMFGGGEFLQSFPFSLGFNVNTAAGGPATDAASIAEAEKRVGKKTE